MRKLELKLKTMRMKLNIESSDLEACLFSLGISQLRLVLLHCIALRLEACLDGIVVLPFLSLFVNALHLFMVGRVEV